MAVRLNKVGSGVQRAWTHGTEASRLRLAGILHERNLKQNNNPQSPPACIRTFAESAAPSAAKGGGDKQSSGKEAPGGKQPSVLTDEYKALWKKVAPRVDIHKTPSDFMKPRPGPTSTLPTKLTVNFVLPSKSEMLGKEVDMVIIPAATGMMGILAGHVPTIAQLSAGLLAVHDGTDVKKFFVSGGFAFVHANSVADIIVNEAVPLENLDVEAARKGLEEYTQKQNSATTDLARAEAQIAVEVYGAIVATMGMTA